MKPNKQKLQIAIFVSGLVIFGLLSLSSCKKQFNFDYGPFECQGRSLEVHESFLENQLEGVSTQHNFGFQFGPVKASSLGYEVEDPQTIAFKLELRPHSSDNKDVLTLTDIIAEGPQEDVEIFSKCLDANQENLQAQIKEKHINKVSPSYSAIWFSRVVTLIQLNSKM